MRRIKVGSSGKRTEIAEHNKEKMMKRRKTWKIKRQGRKRGREMRSANGTGCHRRKRTESKRKQRNDEILVKEERRESF